MQLFGWTVAPAIWALPELFSGVLSLLGAFSEICSVDCVFAVWLSPVDWQPDNKTLVSTPNMGSSWVFMSPPGIKSVRMHLHVPLDSGISKRGLKNNINRLKVV